jgi:hypothetical protein
MSTGPAIPPAAGAGIALGIASLAVGVANLVVGIFRADDQKREAFTQNFVGQAAQQNPNFNVVIVHPAHRVSGDHIHQHVELPMSVGTCGYEVYLAQKGRPFTFVLEGDGGFINWAYDGEFNRNDKTLTAIQHG